MTKFSEIPSEAGFEAEQFAPQIGRITTDMQCRFFLSFSARIAYLAVVIYEQ
jgi:hypothetical protein